MKFLLSKCRLFYVLANSVLYFDFAMGILVKHCNENLDYGLKTFDFKTKPLPRQNDYPYEVLGLCTFWGLLLSIRSKAIGLVNLWIVFVFFTLFEFCLSWF